MPTSPATKLKNILEGGIKNICRDQKTISSISQYCLLVDIRLLDDTSSKQDDNSFRLVSNQVEAKSEAYDLPAHLFQNKVYRKSYI